MPTGQEFGSALRDIAEFVEGCGAEVIGDIDHTTEDDVSVSGYHIQHGNHHVAIHGRQDGTLEFFHVEYPFSAVSDYANLLAAREHDGDLPDQPADSLELDVDVEAAQSDLDRLSEENPQEYEDLGNRLRSLLSSPLSSYSIETTENGAVTEFTVSRKIYPYRNDFDVSDVGRAIQVVVSTGLQGRILISSAYGLDSDIVQELETDPSASEDDDLRYFG